MRHRRRGRKLGRNPNHQRALLRGLATALILTERDATGQPNKPKVKGRIITTLQKAKEVRPLVEHCITVARRALAHQRAADDLATDAERKSEKWQAWRTSEQWQEWNRAVAPVVAARRRALRLLGNKQAVRILFDDLAPRYEERQGGYTRILHLAAPRLGDAAPRAILEFVGTHERARKKGPRPSIEPEAAPAAEPASTAGPEAAAAPAGAADPRAESSPSADN
jgi:large subunit ribosomal protein L17